MDETTVKEQEQQQVAGSATSSGSSIAKSKLRYPLRSSMKLKEEKPPAVVAESTTSSSVSSKRRRQASSVSQSLGVLDLSAKEKSAKPPRRQSIPTKTFVGTPYPKLGGNITPISETRSKRNGNGLGKSETPLSDASRTSVRRTFNRISTASYWLSQIKLSESAAKHSVSLGFFKLALEAGCEPLQQIRDELKSYVRRFELGELEASKELFEKYNISVNPEQQVQVSLSHSQTPEEGSRSSEEDFNSCSSTVGTMNLRPRSLNAAAAPAADDSGKKESVTKKAAIRKNNAPSTKTRSLNSLSSKGTVNSKPVSETGSSKVQKKAQKQIKSEGGKGKNQVKKPGKKSSAEKGKFVVGLAATDCSSEENKENMDEPICMEDVSVTEVV
ncbi:hypothetical protein LINGRAHAP2_LOCUS21525 [Linum grandiflorum]